METALKTVKRYPKYKDSGLDWLGEIPDVWYTEKGKWLFSKEERPTRKEDEIVTCFRDGQVTLRRLRRTDGFTNSIKEHGYQGIRKGDLVIHQMDAFAGSIGVSDSDGKSTPVYSVCTERVNNSVDNYYYAYLLRNMARVGFIESLAKGIRERSTDFRFNDFKELILPFPPLPEQTAIANFLDDKTEKIDRAVSIKEKQIALLKERRQIIIQELVTGKKVWNEAKQAWEKPENTKDSGVEWIGEIPEEWEVKKMKHLLRIKNGQDYKHVLSDSGYPVMGSGGQFAHASEYIYDGEVVLLGRKGTIDRPLYFNGKFWTVDTMFYAIVNESYLTKYIYYISTTIPFKYYTTSTALPSMTQDDLNNNKVVIPKLEIQKKIVKQIEFQSKKIDQAISIKEREIDKLKEYKASLVNDVVLGKVKVTSE